jgi:exonuclease III
VYDFIDRYICCSGSTVSAELTEIQTHKHRKNYCGKSRAKAQSRCRFEFPKPPMLATQLLHPLDPEHPQLKQAQQTWARIQRALNNIQPHEVQHVSVEQFVNSTLRVSVDQYILAVRSTLHRPTIFLKRQPSEMFINAYNPTAITAWQANMDIQYVLDAHAAASYVASYMMKGQRGMSSVLQHAIRRAKLDSESTSNIVRAAGNAFMNGQELSAREVVYHLMSLGMVQSSRSCLYLPTQRSSERTRMLRRFHELEKLPADGTDIVYDSMIEKYAKRPADLHHLCLAEFASCWTLKRKGAKADSDDSDKQQDKACTTYDAVEDSVAPAVHNTSSEYRPCKAKVFRYRHYNRLREPEEWCREQLMLYTPWHFSTQDMIEEQVLLQEHASYQDRYNALEEQVKASAALYNQLREVDWDQIVEDVQNEDAVAAAAAAAATASAGQDNQDEDITCIEDEASLQYDVFGDTRTAEVQKNFTIRDVLGNSRMWLSDEDLHANMRRLNKEQRAFVDHISRHCKTKADEPLHVFLSGGAGVGKSFTMITLYEALLRVYKDRAEYDKDYPDIIVMAPTGKAAFNVHGTTVHSGMNLSPVASVDVCTPLDSDTASKLHNKFKNVKMVIIDEISMVGFRMFANIDLRLQQIMNNNQRFGGLHMLVLGDLFQLRPIKDTFVFQNPDNSKEKFATNLWEELFELYELTTIMRTKDRRFAEVLNKLREGLHTEEDIQYLKARENVPVPPGTPYVAFENAKVDAVNAARLQANPNPLHTFAAVDIRGDKIRNHAAELPSDKDDHKQNNNLWRHLQLKVGMPVEIVCNVDTADGLANGADGEVMQIDTSINSSGVAVPHTAWMLPTDQRVGQLQRARRPHPVQRSWVPIAATCRTVYGNAKQQPKVRKQLPLQLAAARTSYRVQGSTMKSIHVNCRSSNKNGKSRKVPALHYSVLSRPTTYEGLYIEDLAEECISTNQDVVKEMARMRQHKRLMLTEQHPPPCTADNFTVVINNVRSMRSKVADLLADPVLSAAHVLCLNETGCCPSTLPTFLERFPSITSTHSAAQHSTAAHHLGSAVCTQATAPQHTVHTAVASAAMELVHISLANLHIVHLYRTHRQTSATDIADTLEQHVLPVLQTVAATSPLIVCGDFNIDVAEDTAPAKQLKAFMAAHGMKNHVAQPTTKYGSTLDHIWSNCNESQFSSHLHETYWSDHSAVLLQFTVPLASIRRSGVSAHRSN